MIVTDYISFHFQDLGFEGALRFYFEDGKEELTKALRLTNKTLVSELLPTLIEKFKPDLVNSTVEKKAKLYEVYEEGNDFNCSSLKYITCVNLTINKQTL